MAKRTAVIAGGLLLALTVLASGASAAAGAGAPATALESGKPPLQITHRTGVKVVVQVNYSDTIPTGVGKQVLAAKNLYDQYIALGMRPGVDFEMAMVFRADGAQFLLTNEAYDRKVKQPHPPGNPNLPIIEALSKGGVAIYQCALAMRMKGYTVEEIAPFSRLVPSGIGAFVDLQKSGFISVTP